MGSFVDCWNQISKNRERGGEPVLTDADRTFIEDRIQQEVRAGIDPIEAARIAVGKHLEHASSQLDSIYEQAGVRPQEATPQKPSKIGQSIEAKAVEAKLTEGFSETAGYDPVTIQDQAQKATGLIKTSLDKARAVVRGDEPLPDGLRGTSLITAMEEHLLKKPDPQIAYELANSHLTTATSVAAQEMRLMAERVPDSLSAKFAEIQEARRAGSKLRGETPERVYQDIRTEITRQAAKRPTWEAFVREITCA